MGILLREVDNHRQPSERRARRIFVYARRVDGEDHKQRTEIAENGVWFVQAHGGKRQTRA